MKSDRTASGDILINKFANLRKLVSSFDNTRTNAILKDNDTVAYEVNMKSVIRKGGTKKPTFFYNYFFASGFLYQVMMLLKVFTLTPFPLSDPYIYKLF